MSLKCAFAGSAFSSGATVADLMQEIRRDQTLSEGQRLAMLAEIDRAMGMRSKNTPLQNVGSAIFGSVVMNMIAKYFGMGIMGRTVATLTGFGIGPSIFNKFKN